LRHIHNRSRNYTLQSKHLIGRRAKFSMLLIATIAIGVWRTALRQIGLSGDQARVALGQAICLAARYANRLRGNVTGAPWIACARKIVGLECQHSGLVF
jgi:hypothetical protein